MLHLLRAEQTLERAMIHHQVYWGLPSAYAIKQFTEAADIQPISNLHYNKLCAGASVHIPGWTLKMTPKAIEVYPSDGTGYVLTVYHRDTGRQQAVYYSKFPSHSNVIEFMTSSKILKGSVPLFFDIDDYITLGLHNEFVFGDKYVWVRQLLF